MNQSPKRRKTGWAREIARAFGIILKVILTALRWVLNILITVLLIAAITGIIVGSAFAIYIKNFVDTEVDETKFVLSQTNQTTKIYYMEYEDRLNRVGYPVELVDQRLYGESNNLIASFNEFPQHLINACIAGEDKRFWSHDGVDWLRTVKAAANFALGFEDEFGASTLTQQLIKNVTGEKDYKIQRKVQEIFWALDLEQKRSKEDILTMYLNIIPLSRNCYGVKSAAYTYFGKEVEDLTLLESCAIIAITNNPSIYDPVSNPRNNTIRRNGILFVMLEEGMITQSEYDENFNRELELNLQVSTTESTIYSYYTDMVYEDVLADLMEQHNYSRQMATQMLWSGGLEIYTVMDPEAQAIVDEVFQDDANFPENKSGLPAQSSMIVLDPYTCDILAVAGARGEKTINRGTNFATKSVRPAGSSIKPLSVYAPALEEGLITYASVFDDVPVNFGQYNLDPEAGDIIYPDAWPNNYPDVFRGLTNVNSAIERSVNTIAVRVLQKLTLDKSFDFVKNKLKMHSLIETKTLENGVRLTDKDVAALALGQFNYGVTVREITAAYSIFANKGVFNEARSYVKVLDSDGQVLLSNDSAGEVIISEANAAIMTKMLSNVVSRGTATSITLRNQVNVAGKTGTTTNDFDRWFIGYTPYYLGGVWYGYEYPKSLTTPLRGYTSPPNAIWDTVMTRLHEKHLAEAAAGTAPLKTFEMPSTVIQLEVCQDSGMLMSDACRADLRGYRGEVCYFARGTEPTKQCTTHVMVPYDKSTGAVACDGCPRESVVEVGMIRVENRTFPTQVYVVDAQYVYRPLDPNVRPGGWNGVPFFINMLEEDTYCGITSNGGIGQANAFCWLHFDFLAFDARIQEMENRIPVPPAPEGVTDNPTKENESGDPPNRNDPNQE
ncbi:MAG: transglycosylase domain-containing protein [Clostridia bacterium]|nr:transglycosylase domain-containing protein [Clostridia bacterium]